MTVGCIMWTWQAKKIWCCGLGVSCSECATMDAYCCSSPPSGNLYSAFLLSLPQERREIERALLEGQLWGVAATNAMELGVDIGSLDVTLHLGFPGSIASLWQQVRLYSLPDISVMSCNSIAAWMCRCTWTSWAPLPRSGSRWHGLAVQQF
jgi:hypothetical protein